MQKSCRLAPAQPHPQRSVRAERSRRGSQRPPHRGARAYVGLGRGLLACGTQRSHMRLPSHLGAAPLSSCVWPNSEGAAPPPRAPPAAPSAAADGDGSSGATRATPSTAPPRASSAGVRGVGELVPCAPDASGGSPAVPLRGKADSAGGDCRTLWRPEEDADARPEGLPEAAQESSATRGALTVTTDAP